MKTSKEMSFGSMTLRHDAPKVLGELDWGANIEPSALVPAVSIRATGRSAPSLLVRVKGTRYGVSLPFTVGKKPAYQ